MKKLTYVLWLALAAVLLALPAGAGAVVDAKAVATANGPAFHVLVLTEGNPTAGQFAALNKAANQSNPRFDVDQVKNSANAFTERHLSHYNAVVFLNTSGDALPADEQAAFEAYFRNGGGFVGIGTAINTNTSWQFLTDILGARTSTPLAAASVVGATNIKVTSTVGITAGSTIALDGESATVTTVGTAGATERQSR